MRRRATVGAWGLALLLSMPMAGCDRDVEEPSADDQTNPSPTAQNSIPKNPQKGKKTEEQPKAEADEPSAKSGGSKEGPKLAAGTSKQKKLLAKAKTKFLTDDLTAAEPLFEEVIETGGMTGTKASAYIALGQVYIDTGKPREAVELLESMPEAGEEIVEAKLILARAYAAQEKFDEAIEVYRNVIDLQPHYIFAYTAMGALYNERGKKKKAAQMYLKYENKLAEMAAALEHPDKSTAVNRLNILDIFSVVNDQRAEEAVEAALEDPEAQIRAKAAATAGQLGVESATTRLEYLSKKDESERVRQAAGVALKKVRSRKKQQSE